MSYMQRLLSKFFSIQAYPGEISERSSLSTIDFKNIEDNEVEITHKIRNTPSQLSPKLEPSDDLLHNIIGVDLPKNKDFSDISDSSSLDLPLPPVKTPKHPDGLIS